MDLNVHMRSLSCPYTITFYGALFREVRPYNTEPCSVIQVCAVVQGDVWICMELMDKSLHDLYKLVYDKLKLSIPEPVIGKMAESVSSLVSWWMGMFK